MKNNILITSAGQRVSLVKAFQKELKSKISDAQVLTVDLRPELSPACQVSDKTFPICKVTSSDYIYNLLAICEKQNVGLVIPTIDTELEILASNKNIFLENGIHVIVSDLEFVKYCRDKRTLNSFFEKNEIDFPKPVDKTNPTFPLFIKPYDGSLSKDIFVIRKQEELTGYHLQNPKFMFMDYIDPSVYKEFTIDAYYNKNNKLSCAVPRERIAVRSGEIQKGATRKNEIIDYLKRKLDFVPGVIGCLTIQVFFDHSENHIVAIEINPRFGGGYPLSYEAGANYPKFLIEEYFENKEVGYFDNWESDLLMLRYDAEVLVKNYE